jgi:hypothetical protein
MPGLPLDMTPTINTHNCNYFAALADNDDDEEHPGQPQRPQHNNKDATTALSNSGATSHFIRDGAHVVNKQIDTNPITITLPDGATIQSTHTCNMDIPWLRQEATKAHIVPGLAHASLLATAKFCDAGYTISFDALQCKIFDGTTLVLKGERDTASNLWRLPLQPTAPPPRDRARPGNLANNSTHTTTKNVGTHEVIHNVHTIPHLQNRVKFMHQVFFCPPIQTLLRAANLGFLDGFPFLTADLIHKHLPKSPATAKGRLKLRHAGHRSTRTRLPRQQGAETNLFCYAALADKQHGTFYTDCTGRLPARVLDGQQLFFIAYDYDTNYIFALPLVSTSDSEILVAFKQVHRMLTARGYKPVLNITDNPLDLGSYSAGPLARQDTRHNSYCTISCDYENQGCIARKVRVYIGRCEPELPQAL